MIRSGVLIIDNAARMRRALSELVGSQPDMRAEGAASRGELALAKLGACSPEIVLLNPCLEDEDPVDLVTELLRRRPAMEVILVGPAEAARTIEVKRSIQCGAKGFVPWPAEISFSSLEAEVLPVMRDCLEMERSARRRGMLRNDVTKRIVAIGASTGGPAALDVVLSQLPGDFAAPIVIVQHIPPAFTASLAVQLSSRSPLRVLEGKANARLLPGHVYVAPGGLHTVVDRKGGATFLRLLDEPPENNCRPAVDPLFRSVAAEFRSEACAVVMTGMGQDGRRGAECVREMGGCVLAQDEASSVVWGMPGQVVRAGLADLVLPLEKISQHLRRCVLEPMEGRAAVA